MFHILVLNLKNQPITQIQALCHQIDDAIIYESISAEDAVAVCIHTHIHCILLIADHEFSCTQKFLRCLRTMPQYSHIPIVILSDQYAHMFHVFPKLVCCEFFLLPLTPEKELSLWKLLCFYQKSFSHLFHFEHQVLQICTAKSICTLPYDEILFIEIVLKKAIFHTKHGDRTFSMPLYKIRESIQSPYLLQTHRSFIVNLSNISYVDKSKSPWELSFFHTREHAYVSRHYKEEFLHAFTAPAAH